MQNGKYLVLRNS